MTKQELLDKKGRLCNEADQILASAREAGRYDLTPEEDTKWSSIHRDIDAITAFVAKMDKQEGLAESDGRRSEPAPMPARGQESRGGAARLSDEERAESLRAWLSAGAATVERTPKMLELAQRSGINLDNRNFHMKLPRVALRDTSAAGWAEWEKRAAMGVGSGSIGGNTVPDEAMRALEASMLAFGGMRQVATVIRTDSGAALPIPTSNDTSNKGALLAENTQASEVDMTFGQIVLDSFKYSSKYVLVSVELLQDSAINVAEFVGRALGERIGRITNDHFTTGTGSGEPKGIVTAAGDSTVTAASSTTYTYDELVAILHSVDPAYRTNARWMFNDAVLKALKQIKVPQFSGDTAGYPLWNPGLMANGQPDTILGYPYVINQSMTAPATTVKSVIFGDLSKYLIRDVRDVTLLRLDERFADYHQVAFLAFSRHDGDLLDAGTDPVKWADHT